MKQKLRKGLSLTLFLLGLIIFATAPMNVTGAVIGAPQITPGITSLIGIALMFAALMVFVGKNTTSLENKLSEDLRKSIGLRTKEEHLQERLNVWKNYFKTKKNKKNKSVKDYEIVHQEDSNLEIKDYLESSGLEIKDFFNFLDNKLFKNSKFKEDYVQSYKVLQTFKRPNDTYAAEVGNWCKHKLYELTIDKSRFDEFLSLSGISNNQNEVLTDFLNTKKTGLLKNLAIEILKEDRYESIEPVRTSGVYNLSLGGRIVLDGNGRFGKNGQLYRAKLKGGGYEEFTIDMGSHLTEMLVNGREFTTPSHIDIQKGDTNHHQIDINWKSFLKKQERFFKKSFNDMSIEYVTGDHAKCYKYN